MTRDWLTRGCSRGTFRYGRGIIEESAQLVNLQYPPEVGG